MINRDDLELFRYADDPASAFDILTKEAEREPGPPVAPNFAHSRTAHRARD